MDSTSDNARYFPSFAGRFEVISLPERAMWRKPQRGALAALFSHWSKGTSEPGLIALPTGVGKTALGVAAPFISQADRVLVVVPSTAVRRQSVEAFRSLRDLVAIGAIDEPARYPTVGAVTGRVSDWGELGPHDVVVALPNSISPVHYDGNPPPDDLFDLIVVDEAHHAPARTWKAILDHFGVAKKLLLTATPLRSDGKPVPGDLIYHYPLRMALEESLFKPIKTEVLEVTDVEDRRRTDLAIASRTVSILSTKEHATSTLMVRAATVARAHELAATYETLGLDIAVLHSGLGEKRQRDIQQQLKSGDLHSVAVVGMLVEGFDLSSLRVLAYHDKHKSVMPTAQIAGRLARVDTAFPQESVIVTARDLDVYPELRGIVRSLYEEDADWARLLPGVIDDEVIETLEDQRYAEGFEPQPHVLSLESVHPLRRCIMWEVSDPDDLDIDGESVPAPLTEGHELVSRTIVYSARDPSGRHILLITRSVDRPRWHSEPGLDASIYELHIASLLPARQAGVPSLLMINSDSDAVAREIRRVLDPDETCLLAAPDRLQAAFDSLERTSVSSVGVRNTYGASKGAPSYKMYAGSGVDRGLRASDTEYTALGHAMIQATGDNGSYTAGVSTGKSKFWETRYVPLRQYDLFTTELAERFWFPPTADVGQLLPQINRGRRLVAWPAARPLAAEMDPGLRGGGWRIEGQWDLDLLELHVGTIAADWVTLEAPDDKLLIVGVVPDGQSLRHVWTGTIDLFGSVDAMGDDLAVKRGFAVPSSLGELLTERPPTIFFSDGTTVIGPQVFDARLNRGAPVLPKIDTARWTGINITKEESAGTDDSVHDFLETFLSAQPSRARRRWIVRNHGPGELADYVVIELDDVSRVHIGLWHAKASGGANPSVRVTDVEEVTAQAIKSRRWLTDIAFWDQLGRRLDGQASPIAEVLEGSPRLLRVLCGREKRFRHLALTHRVPLTTGEIVIVQPGVGAGALREQWVSEPVPQTAAQVRELLQVFNDSVSASIGVARILISE